MRTRTYPGVFHTVIAFTGSTCKGTVELLCHKVRHLRKLDRRLQIKIFALASEISVMRISKNGVSGVFENSREEIADRPTLDGSSRDLLEYHSWLATNQVYGIKRDAIEITAFLEEYRRRRYCLYPLKTSLHSGDIPRHDMMPSKPAQCRVLQLHVHHVLSSLFTLRLKTNKSFQPLLP